MTDCKVKQRTIGKEVSLTGVGLHTGKEVTITFKPAPENNGYTFVRVDLEGNPVIEADANVILAAVPPVAALAPAEPSAQDRAVATAAAQAETQAQTDLREQQAEQRRAEQASSASQQAQASYLATQTGGRGVAAEPSLDLIA